MKVNNLKYPIFSGEVLYVGAVMEIDGETYSILDYLTVRDSEVIAKRASDMPMPALLLTLSSEIKKDKLKKELSDNVSRATIPMKIDPEILRGANIRTKFGTLEVNGLERKTYEIEVIRGRSRAKEGAQTALAETIDGPPYTGFKYIKILND